LIWDDTKIVAFDFETSGVLPEYALQPWRVNYSGIASALEEAWVTSMSIIRWQTIDDMPKLAPDGSKLFFRDHHRWGNADIQSHLHFFLLRAIENDWTIVGWNVTFDIQWLIAYGCGDLVHKVKWLDAMLLWKHLTVEPEYELDRSKKKSYSLKVAVPEYHAGRAPQLR
jgi:hypothetical protein